MNELWSWLQFWPVRIGCIIAVALLLDVIQRAFFGHLAAHTRRHSLAWTNALLRAAPRPLSLTIWIIAAAWIVEILGYHFGWEIAQIVTALAGLGIIIALTWFALRVTRNAKENLLTRAQSRGEPLDTTTVDALTKAAVVVIILAALVFALQNLGYSISGLLAVGGLGAVAVGLAAQGFLSNFFGGWMIYLTRPFSIGDWVRSPDRQIEGTVERIGWMNTRIRAFDMRPFYIPNSIFNTIVLENPSRMTHRRIYEIIGVRHVDWKSLSDVVAEIEAYLRGHDELDQDQTVMVRFDQLTPNALNFFIYAFTKSRVWVDYQRIKQEILLKIAGIIESYGAEIGQPVATVQLTGEMPDLGSAQRESRGADPEQATND